MTVENRAHHKVHKLQESNDHLVQQISELQEQKTKLVGTCDTAKSKRLVNERNVFEHLRTVSIISMV